MSNFDNFKKIDLLLAGMERTKPEYNTFLYSENGKFAHYMREDGGELIYFNRVFHDIDSDQFEFYYGEKLICVFHADRADEIEERLVAKNETVSGPEKFLVKYYEMEAELKAANETIAEMRMEHGRLKNDNQFSLRRIKRVESENLDLIAQLEESSNELQRLTRLNGDLETNNESFVNYNQIAVDHNRKLSEENTKLRDEVENWKKYYERANAGTNALINAANQQPSRSENKQIEVLVGEHKKEKDYLVAMHDDLRKAHKLAGIEIKSLKEECNELQGAIESLNSEVSHLKGEVEYWQGCHESANAEIELIRNKDSQVPVNDAEKIKFITDEDKRIEELKYEIEVLISDKEVLSKTIEAARNALII